MLLPLPVSRPMNDYEVPVLSEPLEDSDVVVIDDGGFDGGDSESVPDKLRENALDFQPVDIQKHPETPGGIQQKRQGHQ
jgi:hypothetical protein